MQKKKKFIIPGVLLLLLVGLYVAFEKVALKIANDKAQEVNPEFAAHIGDLDLNLLKGGVTLKDITARLKKNDREFMDIKSVGVDLAVTQLLKGDVVFDVEINELHARYDQDIMEAVERLPKEEEKKKELPFRIPELKINDSKITLLGYPGVGPQDHLAVNAINAVIQNISGKKDSSLGLFDINATFTGDSKIKSNGHFDMAAEPVRWDADYELLNFQLAKMNETLRKQVPVSYKQGSLDIYGEVKSTGGRIYGYIKPFLNDVQYVGNNRDFKGATHFLIEALGTFANWTLENSDKETVATRIPFISENGAFSMATGEGIKQAVEHGLFENNEVSRGIENKYSLNEKNPEEVQAQEEDLEAAKEKKKEEEKNEE